MPISELSEDEADDSLPMIEIPDFAWDESDNGESK